MRKNTILTITLLLTTALWGCTTNDATDSDLSSVYDQQFSQGVNIISLSTGVLRVAIADGERVIIMEALRGHNTPVEYQEDPQTPRYEIDVRVTDGSGRLLYLRRGGDAFVNPLWADDMIWQDNLLPAPEGNKALFELWSGAVATLEQDLVREAGEEKVAGIIHEIKALHSFGVNAARTFEDSEEEIADYVAGLDPETLDHLVGGGGSSSGDEDNGVSLSSGWYFIAVHDKDTAVIAKHSATRVSKYLGPGSFSYYDFCNHGTCASDMAKKCSLSMIAKPNWTQLTCKSSYATYSDNGGHNCHDDTRVQLSTFVYGVTNNGYQYWCNGADDSTDISVDLWGWELDQDGSPECNTSTNKGYNFPSMYSYSASYTNSATVNTAQYALVLSAGATYSFSTCGTSSTDTYLRLKNAAGATVAYNDDACGLQSTITVTPTTTGTYYLNGGCYANNACSGKINVTLVSGITPPCTSGPDRLCPGEELLPGQSRTSTDGRFIFTYQGDGNLVLYRTADWYPLWSASSNSTPGRTIMQGDGNLVVYRSDWYAPWSSQTQGSGLYLVVQSDGNVVIYDPSGIARWATNTGWY